MKNKMNPYIEIISVFIGLGLAAIASAFTIKYLNELRDKYILNMVNN